MSALRALSLALALAAAAGAAWARPDPPAAPPDTLRLSLDDAVQRALASGAEARVARASVGVAEGQVREAMAEALPQVTGDVVYDRKFSSIFQSLSSDTLFGPLFAHSSFAAVHGWTADLTATQLLWSGGRVGAGLAAARAARDWVRATRDETLADFALQVRSAYLEAVYARDVQRIAGEGLAQSRAHLEQVKLLHDQGSRSEYDLLQAQVDAANAEPQVVSARNATEQSTLLLKRLMNLPLSQPIVLTTALAFEGGLVPVMDADPGDGAARPAIRGADDLVQARRQAVRAEKAARWPKLSASATVSQQAYPTDLWPTRRDFVSAVDGYLKLEWPLFQGFRTFGTVQRATSELRQAEADRDRTLQSVSLEVEQARQEVQRTLATLVARRGTADLARRTHHLATVRWQSGLSTQLEVTDARLQLQTAEVNEVAAIKDYRLALIRMERASNRPLALTPRSIEDLSHDSSIDGVR